MSYHPTLGRFIQRDPLQYVDGGSLYEYVRSGPMAAVDPYGLAATMNVKWKWNGLYMEPDLAVFSGYENSRYQELDWVIAMVVSDFNRNKEAYCGCTANQGSGVPNLDADMVKSWFIQETGGNDRNSRAAWSVDPGQVNVPGDWNDYKADLGLGKPTRRNEGDLLNNVRAAVAYLCRKGFGTSGQPARNREDGFFDGWPDALRRYNGRGEMAGNGKRYRDNYADRITDRAKNPDQYFPIELPKPR